MNGNVQHLYNELLELAKVQKDALIRGGFEDTIKIQEMRQGIIDKIQNIDRSEILNHISDLPTGKNGPEREEFSKRIRIATEKILSLDNEMRAIIQAELSSIADRLKSIQKIKAFCHNASPHRYVGNNLNVSVS
ncbi:MAG: flagellar protein FliT [Desulfobacterales bacterium]|nr:flagellar protein FliT [Desulfobacterales bacterium]